MNEQNKKYLDRELLQDAAKAAGYCVRWVDAPTSFNYEGFLIKTGKKLPNELDAEIMWNPLTNDGDALRLAVKLGIHIIQINDRETWSAWIDANGLLQTEPTEDDYAATRRAIVRSAAAIGRNMA